ncbi:FAD-dependent oxidoreductase [Amphritea atlantica]|uniref:FAD-dependent oxidoreductase n=1 Tax=Amphritea atlantica TaxID=355243 RepID=A0ABY5GSP5_9GAMM|nr:FAD-dependent oxidoreductase [Amphritea atlantica]
MKEIHILGGGFAGVWAAMSAAAERNSESAEMISIELVSKTPDLIIRPRLYQGASQALSVPLAPLMKEIGVNFRVAEVRKIDAEVGRYRCSGGEEREYDRLILATGSELKHLPISGMQEYTWSIDNFEDTERLDFHLDQLTSDDPAENTIVIIGAGFTGLELATELRSRLGDKKRIILVDQAVRAGNELGPAFIPFVEEAVAQCGIETHLGTTVSCIWPGAIKLENGKLIESRTVIMATGLVASPLTRSISGEYDAQGRLKVTPDLKVPGAESIFVAGDTAHTFADDNHATLLSCQHATELGRFAGYNAVHDLLGNELQAYRQPFYATCLDLGAWGAVFSTGWEREVKKVREEGKAIKTQINNEWIMPPNPELGKLKIFEQIALTVEVEV